MERESDLSTLYPLQDRILAAFSAADTEFYLTGGTAASRGYLQHRFSDDLDLFVNDDKRFALWADRLIASVAGRGEWTVSVELREPRFVRFTVVAEANHLKVELVTTCRRASARSRCIPSWAGSTARRTSWRTS